MFLKDTTLLAYFLKNNPSKSLMKKSKFRNCKNNWECIRFVWNDAPRNKYVEENLPMPDYTKLPTTK